VHPQRSTSLSKAKVHLHHSRHAIKKLQHFSALHAKIAVLDK